MDEKKPKSSGVPIIGVEQTNNISGKAPGPIKSALDHGHVYGKDKSGSPMPKGK